MKNFITQKPIYIYLAFLCLLFGMFTVLIPFMDLFKDISKNEIKLFNPVFNNYQLFFLYLSTGLSGFYFAFKSFSFIIKDYLELDKPNKKSHLKILK